MLDRVMLSLLEQKKLGASFGGYGAPTAGVAGGVATAWGAVELLSGPAGALAALPFAALFLKDKMMASLIEGETIGSVKAFVAVELVLDAALAAITAAALIALFGSVPPLTLALAAGVVAGPALVETALNSVIALSKRLAEFLHTKSEGEILADKLEEKIQEMATLSKTSENDPHLKRCRQILEEMKLEGADLDTLKNKLRRRAGLIFCDHQATKKLYAEFKKI